MSSERRPDAHERLADRLVSLMGEYYARQPNAPGYDEEWFLEWLAREARARLTAGERQRAAARADAFAERVLAKAIARRYGVEAVPRRPRERRPLVVGPARTVLEAAARAGCIPCVDLAVAAGTGRELWDEDCERWIERPSELPSGRYVALIVAGDSMTPLLHAGDMILVRLGNQVNRDTILVARRPDEGYVVKRVRAVRGRRIELASLNPAYPPLAVPRRAGAVLGTVVMRWCAHGEGRGISRR